MLQRLWDIYALRRSGFRCFFSFFCLLSIGSLYCFSFYVLGFLLRLGYGDTKVLLYDSELDQTRRRVMIGIDGWRE